MNGHTTAITAALALVLAGTAHAGDDDRAVPRGGGSSGGSSSAGERHHGGGSSSGSSSSHSGSSSSSSSSDSSRYSPQDLTPAQRRHPRAGTGTGGRQHYGNGGYYNPYYYPYNNYYWNWGLGWHYGYSPYFYGGGYGYDPYFYNHRYYSSYRTGSVRVMVEPSQTRVYVDGYYAGVADDFDGLFQRLNLSPGKHEVAFKLEGHRSFKVKVYVPLDQTVKVRHRMVQGTGEDESAEAIGRPDSYARYEERRPPPDEAEYEANEVEEGEDVGEDGGTLRLSGSPEDASVYVDGAFKGTVRTLRRLQLSPGKHRIELVRPGYRTLEREVEIRAGRATDLQIDLDRS
jgi:PEGA domain